MALVIVAASLVACSGGGGSGSSDADVTMTDAQAFEPKELTIAAGETIVFENTSSQSHTVTAYQDGIPPGGDYFASGGASSEEAATSDLAGGLLASDETFELTLDQPGTYTYYCIPHEGAGMTGTITVTG